MLKEFSKKCHYRIALKSKTFDLCGHCPVSINFNFKAIEMSLFKISKLAFFFSSDTLCAMFYPMIRCEPNDIHSSFVSNDLR